MTRWRRLLGALFVIAGLASLLAGIIGAIWLMAEMGDSSTMFYTDPQYGLRKCVMIIIGGAGLLGIGMWLLKK